MIRATIDRIEDDWLIIIPESGPVFLIPVSLFPGLKEGDIVHLGIEKEEEEKKEVEDRITEILIGLKR